MRLLMILGTLALGSGCRLAAQELAGPRATESPAASQVEAEESANPSLLGPTTAVTQRAEVSANRSLEAGALADTTNTSRRLPVQLALTLIGYYDDNIYVQPGNRVGDFIYDVVPSLAYNSAAQTGVDNSISLNYAPSFVFYQDHSGNNTVEQNGTLVYGFHGTRSDFVLSQQYVSVQNSAPDLGDLVKMSEYLTTLNLDYSMTAKLSLTLRAEQDVIDYAQGFDSRQWTGSAYLNYAATPKTTWALGLLGGYADISGPNQRFVQVNGRVIYTPTEKLNFSATGGVELRRTTGFEAIAATPVFSAGFSYTPWDQTNVTLNGYRETKYSARFYGEDYLATGFSGSISQGIYQKMWLTLSGSYENADYQNNLQNEPADLEYNYFALRSSLDFKLTDWCLLNAYYQFRGNFSDTIPSFIDNQVGLESRFNY